MYAFCDNQFIMDEHVSFAQKFKKITENKQLFDSNELKAMNELKFFEEIKDTWKEQPIDKPDLYSKCIKLQTFYKCSMPAYYSVVWEEQINYKTTHPITAVISFLQEGEEYYSLDHKFVNWVQSGGTKVIPIKADVNEQKLASYTKNIHALIIPQFKTAPKSNIFELIAKAKESNKELPILVFGSSALMLLSCVYQEQNLRKYCLSQQKVGVNNDVFVYASHKDAFFADLSFRARLQIQNKPKVLSSNTTISVQRFLSSSKLKNQKILGLSRSKQQWNILLSSQNLTYSCFIHPQIAAANNQSTTFYHKIIINFMQQVRKISKVVEQKYSEVGQCKMQLKGNRYIYNCDVRLPKI